MVELMKFREHSK